MNEPTRIVGLERLAAFVPHAGRDYRSSRNEDRGPADRCNVSMLSPYIRARLVTEEEVLRATLARHQLPTAEKFVQEVLWRTYWKGWLESRPSLWQQYRRDVEAAHECCGTDADLARRYEDAIAGRTGNEAFDSWSRELIAENYLHNHARMWYASLWIFTLGLPWELGADFFMRHLLCGDPAANTLSWRWVAGLQTKGKTYRATRENIRRYTRGRLDPGVDIARVAPPLAGATYDVGPLPELRVDPRIGEPAMLVLHDDDAGIESLPLARVDIRTSVGLCAVGGRSSQPMAPAVVAFARGALEDALCRAPFGERRKIVDVDERTHRSAADILLAHALRYGVRTAIVPYAPVGPVRDALCEIAPRLARGGVRVVECARTFDAIVWPFATRGFFNLKEKIPHLLLELGLRDGGT